MTGLCALGKLMEGTVFREAKAGFKNFPKNSVHFWAKF